MVNYRPPLTSSSALGATSEGQGSGLLICKATMTHRPASGALGTRAEP